MGLNPQFHFTLTMVGLQVLFLSVFSWLTLPFFGEKSWLVGYYLVSPALAVTAWLWVKATPTLFLKPDATPLVYFGAANRLTLFRLSSLPALGYLLVLSRSQPEINLPLTIWAGLAFLTDFFDGWISRTRGEVSRLGQAMDSASDYLVLGALVSVFATQGLLPWWLLLAAGLRLGFQIVSISVLMWKKKGLILETTFLGKVAVFILMTYFGLRLVGYVTVLPQFFNSGILFSLDIFTAVLLAVSLVDKILYFSKTWASLSAGSSQK